MDRKWIGVLISLVLAAVGTWVLVQYVNGADERAREGTATVDVLVVSEDLDELFEICDRLAVIAEGRLSPVVNNGEITIEEIGLWMSGDFAARTSPGGAAPQTEAADAH